MKKLHALLIVAFFSAYGLFGQVKNLVVESTFDQMSSGVYLYKGIYNNHNYWVGPKSNNRYVVCFDKNYLQWVLTDWFGDTAQMFGFARDLSSTKDAIPLSGWNNYKMSLEGPTLNYSDLTFTERITNDGEIRNKIKIAHNKYNGEIFAGTAGEDLVLTKAVEVERIPEGLTAHAIVQNDSIIDFYLEGNAKDHAIDTNIYIKFTDAAFSNGGKADSTQKSNIVFNINWINKFKVAKAGGDFLTIQEALSKTQSGDILHIKEGVYTEYALTPSVGVVDLNIFGDGPDKTIIQGDTLPFIGKGRVFNLTGLKNIHIDGVTIQNGNEEKGNGYGGAIYTPNAFLKIENSRILNNRAFSTGSGQTVAGGIMAGSLDMNNCEVVGNICDNGNKGGQILGGGIVIQTYNGFSKIENSTFSQNFARMAGGAIANFSGNLELINCTISENSTMDNSQSSSQGIGGGVWSQDSVWVYNTIVYGNIGTTNRDIYVINGVLITANSIIKEYGNSNADSTTNLVGTYDKADPKLDTLAFNCSVTRTFGLLEGSPAIDAGDQSFAKTVTDQRGYQIMEKRDIGSHEANNIVSFEIEFQNDTICLDRETGFINLNGYPSNGTFEGTGVNGKTLEISQITEEGWIKITYKFSAPGCENMEVVDSIYAKVCEVNSKQKIQLPVRMYPNPVQSELHFDLNTSDLMDIQIMDISGKLVHGVSQVSPKTSVNVADLPNGLYFVKVVSGGRSAHMKFIKN